MRRDKLSIVIIFKLERAKGIEPSSDPWQGPVLPLNHARVTSDYTKLDVRMMVHGSGRRSREGLLKSLIFQDAAVFFFHGGKDIIKRSKKARDHLGIKKLAFLGLDIRAGVFHGPGPLINPPLAPKPPKHPHPPQKEDRVGMDA